MGKMETVCAVPSPHPTAHPDPDFNMPGVIVCFHHYGEEQCYHNVVKSGDNDNSN
jgi:hypothetical protein